MRYFVDSENAATPANTHHAWVLQWSPAGVPGTRRISATPLPVSIALAGHTNARWRRNVIATSMTAQVRMAARICGTLTWNRSVDLPEDVDRDDDRGDVQARVAAASAAPPGRCGRPTSSVSGAVPSPPHDDRGLPDRQRRLVRFLIPMVSIAEPSARGVRRASPHRCRRPAGSSSRSWPRRRRRRP